MPCRPHPHPSPFRCSKCGETSQFEAGRYRYCRPCDRIRVKAKDKRRPRKRNRTQYLARRHSWLLAGDCTSADLRSIFEAASGCCEYCGSSVKPTRMNKMKFSGFDHVLPMALGGRHARANIVLSCFSCNSRKRDTHPDIFAPGLLARLAGMEASQ